MSLLKEYQNQVVSLIAEQKWPEAYRLCNEILKYDQDNQQFNKFKRQIEQLVSKQNQKNIKATLKKLNPLLQQGQYQEYLQQLSPLQAYIKDYPEIAQLFIKAKKAFDHELKNKQEKIYQTELKDIQSLSKSLNYQQTIQKLNDLLKLNIHQNQIQKLILKYQLAWQKAELSQNSSLLKSQKFEDILIFLLKLEKIQPQNTRIQALLSKTKKDYQYFKIDNQKDFIFKTLEEIKTLFIKKNYDKSIILCERLLLFDPKNQQVLNYLNKSIQKAEQISTLKIEKQIVESFQSFPDSKAFKNQNYVSI